ncbi:MAG: Lrp/AsnC family transcriptional regulator [Aquificae bacterium]|nr:Lrp/AsnC family transcriptional regulator [Aquificota bacterium]
MEGLLEIEKELLKELQEGIPITERPFLEIGKKLDIDEKEIIDTVKKLKEEKIIRQISPIYDTKALGYDSSLVAFKTDNIEKTAEFINTHPGVSHNYERTDEFNLWFTLAVPPDSKLGLEKTIQVMAEKTKTKDYVILKTEKLFKIGVKLTFSDTKEKEEIKEKKEKIQYSLSEKDKEIIKITQEDIPLVEKPFEEYAKKLNISEKELIEKLNLYKKAGIMRRFAAILFHRKAGFRANGMTVWKVPEEKVEEVGYKLASYKAVSHCYKRTTNEKWQYNIFAMTHAQSKEELEELVKEMSKETGIKEYKILYSTREFKKKRIKYFSEDFYKWEKNLI